MVETINIFEQFKPAILAGIMSVRLPQSVRIEDILQDVYVKIEERFYQCQADSDAGRGAFLKIMARRIALDIVEKVVEYQAVDKDISRRDLGQLRVDLQDAISQLKPIYQAVVESYYFGGSSVKEVAEELGVPVSTVKRRLHIARKKLKEIMS